MANEEVEDGRIEFECWKKPEYHRFRFSDVEETDHNYCCWIMFESPLELREKPAVARFIRYLKRDTTAASQSGSRAVLAYPRFYDGYPQVVEARSRVLSFEVRTMEPAKLFWCVLPGVAGGDIKAPTTRQMQLGEDGLGRPVDSSLRGKLDVFGYNRRTITCGGLEPDTQYTICCVLASNSTGQMPDGATVLRTKTDLCFPIVPTGYPKVNNVPSAPGAVELLFHITDPCRAYYVITPQNPAGGANRLHVAPTPAQVVSGEGATGEKVPEHRSGTFLASPGFVEVFVDARLEADQVYSFHVTLLPRNMKMTLTQMNLGTAAEDGPKVTSIYLQVTKENQFVVKPRVDSAHVDEMDFGQLDTDEFLARIGAELPLGAA
mmetsp:Transcript_115261/g.264680  ORF Transcript_115261/g.264680 Transcript_115261/m.264680 type:complete len:377 (-) Transcript_115261:230-1360(-)